MNPRPVSPTVVNGGEKKAAAMPASPTSPRSSLLMHGVEGSPNTLAKKLRRMKRQLLLDYVQDSSSSELFASQGDASQQSVKSNE